MFEELRDKKVKIIVGTNSGVSVGGGAVAAPGFLTIEGMLSDFDDKMIKLSNAQMTGAMPGGISIAFGMEKYIPDDYEVVFINRAAVITISA